MGNSLKEIIRLELLKRGIIVDVNYEVKGNKIEVETSDFQTSPVLFQRLYVYGYGSITKEENDVNVVYLSVKVGYETFDFGSNGVKLFNITLRGKTFDRMMIGEIK